MPHSIQSSAPSEVAWGTTQTLANMAEAHAVCRARMAEVGLTEVLAHVLDVHEKDSRVCAAAVTVRPRAEQPTPLGHHGRRENSCSSVPTLHGTSGSTRFVSYAFWMSKPGRTSWAPPSMGSRPR